MNDMKTVPVWDLGVRLFHWSLVATFGVAYFSKTMHDLHTWSGYTLIALLLFRLTWGFIGCRHARFSDFIYGPGRVYRYLRGLAIGHPPDYEGHNPAGGWMILLMLVVLSLTSFTGLKALAYEGEGPFAGNGFALIGTAYAHGDETHNTPAPTPEPPAKAAHPNETAPPRTTIPPVAPPAPTAPRETQFWSDSHSLLVDLMLVLVALHLAGVLASSLLHRQNLVRAMITGRKNTGES